MFKVNMNIYLEFILKKRNFIGYSMNFFVICKNVPNLDDNN